MPTHPLTNFEIWNYYQNKPKFVYFRNNLTKIKDGSYILNLDELKLLGTHWIAIFVKTDLATYMTEKNILQTFFVIKYFRFWFIYLLCENSPPPPLPPPQVKYILKEKKIKENKNIPTNIYRIQEDNSIMSGFLYNGFYAKG